MAEEAPNDTRYTNQTYGTARAFVPIGHYTSAQLRKMADELDRAAEMMRGSMEKSLVEVKREKT